MPIVRHRMANNRFPKPERFLVVGNNLSGLRRSVGRRPSPCASAIAPKTPGQLTWTRSALSTKGRGLKRARNRLGASGGHARLYAVRLLQAITAQISKPPTPVSAETLGVLARVLKVDFFPERSPGLNPALVASTFVIDQIDT